MDYVLINSKGERVGLPIAYRDDRTDGVMQRAMQAPGKTDIYLRSGIQFLPFNTLYQLRALAEQQPELLEQAAHALLIPGLFQLPADRQSELGVHQRHHHATGQYQHR